MPRRPRRHGAPPTGRPSPPRPIPPSPPHRRCRRPPRSRRRPPRCRPPRPRPRHWGALAGFAAAGRCCPFAAATAYLFTRAADQYHSEVAFSVRSEEVGAAAAGLLGALTQIGSGTASDADILYDYIRSQEIVEAVDAELDLRTIWNRPGSGWRDGDPVFTLGDDPRSRRCTAHWLRMVDRRLRLQHRHHRRRRPAPSPPRTPGRSPRRSSRSRAALVNAARRAGARGRGALRPRRARRGRGAPRARCAPSSPTSAAPTTSSTPGRRRRAERAPERAERSELAQALVDARRADHLRRRGRPAGGPGRPPDRRDHRAHRGRARARSAVTGVAGSLPEVVGRYEELAVDLEFANTAYTQALAGLAAARAEARRQSRYLAPHVRPTLATTALYPRRCAARRPDRPVPAARLGRR